MCKCKNVDPEVAEVIEEADRQKQAQTRKDFLCRLRKTDRLRIK